MDLVNGNKKGANGLSIRPIGTTPLQQSDKSRKAFPDGNRIGAFEFGLSNDVVVEVRPPH
jgi:hypothetical protein